MKHNSTLRKENKKSANQKHSLTLFIYDVTKQCSKDNILLE